MKPIALLLAAVLMAPAARATSEVVNHLSREQLSSFDKMPAGVTATVRGDAPALEIEIKGDGNEAAAVALCTLRQPKITTNFYALVGQIRYEDVAGAGYLEMWSHFGETAAYYSRTLGEGGPMGKLAGRSGWRTFVLPFNATETGGAPTSLDVSLHLPGRGTVVLRGLELRQDKSMEALFGLAPGEHAWWSDRTAGWAGGTAGALLGCLATLIGWLVKQGKARTFVVIATWTVIALGAIAFVACLIAVGQRQPYGVWYPLGLLGLLCSTIFSIRLRQYRRSFREFELRKMSSLDALET